ncbi:hypothetical protein EWM64_g4144 [Hericium alpestre]|uniref:Uncharacterized protein n=1 Tax=Hericium alpestre TaxID=135208 RepID=A0A4Y9ZYH1_9AGAM|nr:hypothetical protein EWM64_g4144 [Hericium alpestre]
MALPAGGDAAGVGSLLGKASGHKIRSTPREGHIRAQHDRAPSNSYGRLPSESSFKLEDMDEDVSAFFLKMNEFKKTKGEMEEKCKENEELRSQIAVLQEEAKRDISNVKNAAKKALERGSRELEEMRNIMTSLTTQSHEVFGFAKEVRSSLPDAEEIRETIKTSIENFESLFDGDGKFARNAETREIVAQLQWECTANLAVIEQANASKAAQREAVEAISAGAETEAKHQSLEEKYEKLRVEAANDRDALQAMESLRADQQQSEITSLKKALEDKGPTIHDLQRRCAQAEAREAAGSKLISTYEKEITKQEEQLSKLTLTNDQTVKGLETQITAVKEDLDHTKERAQQAQGRLQLVQQRFEDQSITLQLTKEENGEIQERLVASEKNFTETLNNELRKLQGETHVLEERNRLLQLNSDESKQETRRLQELLMTLQKEFGDRAKVEQDTNLERMYEAQKRVAQAEDDRAQARRQADDLREQLLNTRRDYETLKERSEHALSFSTDHLAELEALRSQVQSLQTEKSNLVVRAQTIHTRYRISELSDAEKLFVNAILKETGALYEQKLADKQNELRRKANQCDGLQAKNNQLEKTLARHLKTEAKAKPSTGFAPQSIMNLTGFMSSEPSMPMSQAPDSDEPCETNDTPSRVQQAQIVTGHVRRMEKNGDTDPKHTKETTAAGIPGTSAAANIAPVPDEIVSVRTPKRSSGKVMFSRFDSEEQDEIFDFDFDGKSPPVSASTPNQRDKRSAQNVPEEVIEGSRPGKRAKRTTKAYSRKTEERPGDGKKAAGQTSKLRSRREK